MHYSKQLGNLVKTVEGATDLYVEQVSGTPQIVIEYNRPAIAQFGLNIVDINRNVNTAFAGQSAGLVFEGEKRFDLVVRLENNQRKNIKDVQQLLIPTPYGNQIPLEQVAKVSLVNSPSQIQREDTKRRILVGFNVSGRDVESIVNELQEKAKTAIKLPTGYTITYGGSFENLNEAKSRLMVAVPVSLILIFLLLYFAFGSIKYGLLIYTAIPLSAIGGIFFLALRGMPFSISAGVGFIALFGIAVLNGIVLVAEFNNIKKSGELDMKKVVLEGTKTRLRPVLMTAFVASLGFLPMAISNGAGAAVQRPLATVVIGGLLIATLLTLFVLPILYVAFEKGIRVRKKKASVLMLLLIFGAAIPVSAQKSITHSAALDSLYKNNSSLKSNQLKTDYRQSLTKTATTIAPLLVNGEYGRYNSNLVDNKWGIVQSFSLPGVYKGQKDKYLAEWKTSVLEQALNKAELSKLTSQIFYELLVLEAQQQKYFQADSAYRKFQHLAQIRLKSGESNSLEKSNADHQLLQLVTKVKQAKAQEIILQQQLAFLLGSTQFFTPKADHLKAKLLFVDTSAVNNHPLLKVYRQEENVATAATKLEQAKLLPAFTVGYNNTTLIDGIRFGKSDRFHSFQIGVNVPVFGGAQRNTVKSAKINENYRKAETTLIAQQLTNRIKSTYLQYQQQLEIVADFERTGLKTADEITRTLNRQLANGAINYLEWTLLNKETIEINENYFEAIKQLNNITIELNYLLAQ